MLSISYMCGWLLYQRVSDMQPPCINSSPPLPPVAPCDSPQRGVASREDQTVSTVNELHLIATCRCTSCVHGCHLTCHCGTFTYLSISQTPHGSPSSTPAISAPIVMPPQQQQQPHPLAQTTHPLPPTLPTVLAPTFMPRPVPYNRKLTAFTMHVQCMCVVASEDVRSIVRWLH